MYVYCFKLLHSCSNSTSSAHAKQEHYIRVWQAQAHITTCSPSHCFHFSSRSLPSLTSRTNFHWMFPVSFSNSPLCLCLSHTPQSLWRTIHFLVLTYTSPLLLLLIHVSLFIPSSLQPTSWSGSKSEWFSWNFPSQKRGRARQARSCQSSCELTTRAGLGQINRTKLIIDFNHY